MRKVNMLLTGALALAGVRCFAGDLAIEGNLNVTSNLTSWSLSTAGAAVGLLMVEGNTTMSGTLSVSGQRIQMGTNATSSHANTFVWSDGTVLASTASNQFSAFALNGFRLMGGPIYGNGYGITNFNPSAAVPTNSVTADKLAANSVTSAKIQDGSIADAHIAASAAIAQSKVAGLSALATSVGTHAAALDNPHQVTAAQVGAYTTNQTAAAIASAISGINLGLFVQTNHAGDVKVNGLLSANSFKGDGSTLTNLNLSAYAGNNLTWDGASNKLNAAAGYTDSNAVAAVIAQWASLSDGDDDSRWTGTSAGLDPVTGRNSLGLGSAATNNVNAFAPANLAGYASSTVIYSNNHFYAAVQLTSADVTNAVLSAWPNLDTQSSNDLTTAGGTLAGNLNMNSAHRVTNLAAPQADGDAASKAYLRAVLSALPPQGDLAMGSFTNGAPASFQLTF